MIRFETGDILKQDCEAIVNTVNCVGVMGKGIALQCKRAYPANFRAYSAACLQGRVVPGSLFTFDNGGLVNPRYIINFPTKRHWRNRSRIGDIDAGLVALVREIKELKIRSIAIPPLGSGLGGLSWPHVRQKIVEALSPLAEVDILVLEPRDQVPLRSQRHPSLAPEMTLGRAALLVLGHRYLGNTLDPYLTNLELQKLMYFLQSAGEPLRLNFRPQLYGPYAENLRHVLTRIEGHMIRGYEDVGDGPDIKIELLTEAIETAHSYLAERAQTQARIGRVTSLVEGFESAVGLELLATVHWVMADKKTAQNHDAIVNAVHGWSRRKQNFTPRQIGIASSVLMKQGWCGGCGELRF